jgi:hypothetical protein
VRRAALLPRVAIAVLALGVLVGVLALRGQPGAAPEPLYTPAQFAAHNVLLNLKIGQMIRLRGRLQAVLPNAGSPYDLIYGADGRTSTSVLVLSGPSNPLIERLRGLPLVGSLLPLPPTPDHPITGRMATFRLRAVRCMATALTCAFRVIDLQLVDGGTL